jgi:hypothetical protein
MITVPRTVVLNFEFTLEDTLLVICTHKVSWSSDLLLQKVINVY